MTITNAQCCSDPSLKLIWSYCLPKHQLLLTTLSSLIYKRELAGHSFPVTPLALVLYLQGSFIHASCNQKTQAPGTSIALAPLSSLQFCLFLVHEHVSPVSPIFIFNVICHLSMCVTGVGINDTEVYSVPLLSTF